MDLEGHESALRKIKLGQLEPGLQQEILQFASEMGYETTISSSTSVHFIYTLYESERAKERKDRKALRKAEDLIMRLSSLHLAVVEREQQRRQQERKIKIPLTMIEGGLSIGKKTRELLGSIGIEDEKVIVQATALFGDAKLEERVDIVKTAAIGDELTKKLFKAHPETILIAKDDDFIAELEAIESKKLMLESWGETKANGLPVWADFNKLPGILLDSFEDITRQLGIKIDEPPEEAKRPKYEGKPMDPEDFTKVIMEMGFEPKREAKHGVLMEREGTFLCVQRGHRKQEMLNTATIKKKLTEAGINLDEFEEIRRMLKL